MTNCSLKTLQGIAMLSSFAIGFAQKAETKAMVASKPAIKIRSLDLAHVEPLLGLPLSTAVGYPEFCSSDGTIFSEVYAVADKGGVADFPDIYSISEQREVKKVNLPLPVGYKQVSLRSLYSSARQVVALVQVSQPNLPDPSLGKASMVSYLSMVDRDGADPELVRLELGFQPMKVAIFDSGQLLVLGVDLANSLPVLALVHEDGTLQKIIDLDARTYTVSRELSQTYTHKANDTNTIAMQRPILGALTKAQLVAWGTEVVLVQPGSSLPVYRIHDSGQIETVTINPPDGFLLEALLGSSEKDSWVIVTSDASAFGRVASGGVAENPAEHLFEVDPYTGELIDQLQVKGPQPGEVSCGAHGKLSLNYYGLPAGADGADRLTYASAPR